MKRINSLLAFLMVVIALVLLSNLPVFAKKKHKTKKPVYPVDAVVFDVDASGVVFGAAVNYLDLNNQPLLLYSLSNYANVYDSSYANLPCPNVPNPNFRCEGNRGFRTQIPASACDGNPHVIYVYDDRNTINT